MMGIFQSIGLVCQFHTKRVIRLFGSLFWIRNLRFTLLKAFIYFDPVSFESSLLCRYSGIQPSPSR